MNIGLKEGRFFSHQDSSTTPHVAVIDEEFAKKFFPGEDPVGKRFSDDYLGTTQIVGVVGHVKQWGLDDNKIAMHAEFYVPFAQIPDKAMSDGAQSLYPEQLQKLMAQLRLLAPVVGRTVA